MKFRNKIFSVILTILILFLILIPSVSAQTLSQNDNSLKAHFIDVGQGDSIFIKNNSENMLVDTGNSLGGDKVINYLNKIKVSKIDRLVITHPDIDHMGGAIKIVEHFGNIENGVMISSVMEGENAEAKETYGKLMKLLEDKNIDVIKVKTDYAFNVGEIKNKVLYGETDLAGNDASLVLDVSYLGRNLLLTGDMTSSVENILLNENLVKHYDVLKVAHHGAKTSSSIPFLNKVKPTFSIISVGKNSYGHPTKETINNLTKVGSKIYRTDRDGSVLVTIDDKGINVTKEKAECPSTGISVTSSASMYLSEKKTIKASLTPDYSTDKITFSSSNTKIAVVSSSGVITGKKVGKCYVYAKSTSGKIAKCLVTVKAPILSVSKKKISLYTSFGTSIKGSAKPSSYVKFKSYNNKIVTVSSKGTIKARRAGKTYILVYSSLGRKVKVPITVKQSKLKLFKKTGKIIAGKKAKIKAKCSPKNKIKFVSSNKRIATVNSKGIVTGKKAGTTTIKVKANGITLKYKIKVLSKSHLTVYISNRKSTCYHYSKTCLKSPKKTTLGKAKKAGYLPCKRCVK
ncbi:Ig-like domain-containing protein [Anaerofustis stercorihominis]|uniref:MBL fold metallo-hydrolase n=1 Tax=Anaerofustis stercorihominis TaxID=214853 RepID=UPI00210B1FF2|nr:MBL fold metallo-hydrolase [Anaerofustis stercorihominis]MCQ4795788.1 Ig-like domain-containing protein [Anaerofustis stercorihominis]